MKNYFFLLFVGLIAFSSCNRNAAKPGQTEFGEAFKAKKVMSYDEFLTAFEGKTEMNDIVVEGTVESVCQMKGCWMNIVSETEGKPEMFVKFQDYGFFMPLDLTGKVIMKGRAYTEITSVDELKHYAEDEGLAQEEIDAITEPKEELKFMATGVKVVK